MSEVRHLIAALSRAAQQDWRAANTKTTGPVTHVNPKEGKARIRLGGTDEEPFLSPWVRYAQTMGALKVHTPPSIGQQMDLTSDNGDFSQGTLTPRTQSDENKSPSEKGDENILTFGSVTMAVRDKQVLVEVGGSKVDVTDQKIVVSVGERMVELTAAGGHLK